VLADQFHVSLKSHLRAKAHSVRGAHVVSGQGSLYKTAITD